MKSHFELKRTALHRPATTTRPRRMDTKESWTPSRYLEEWRKYWKTLKPFESSATYVFATWTPRSKAVPRTRSIWFQRLRSQSSEDLLVLHYNHHITRSNWSNYFMTGALSWQKDWTKSWRSILVFTMKLLALRLQTRPKYWKRMRVNTGEVWMNKISIYLCFFFNLWSLHGSPEGFLKIWLECVEFSPEIEDVLPLL